MKSEKKGGGGEGELWRDKRWEIRERERGGRYSHVINDKWWQSVGGRDASSFTAHYQQSASCWGGTGGGTGGEGGRHPRPCQPASSLQKPTAQNFAKTN